MNQLSRKPGQPEGIEQLKKKFIVRLEASMTATAEALGIAVDAPRVRIYAHDLYGRIPADQLPAVFEQWRLGNPRFPTVSDLVKTYYKMRGYTV